MKLSGCAGYEFTCGDGQCININKRCDQINHCRDKTDELDCRLLVLEDGYNQAIPPFTMVINKLKDLKVAKKTKLPIGLMINWHDGQKVQWSMVTNGRYT